MKQVVRLTALSLAFLAASLPAGAEVTLQARGLLDLCANVGRSTHDRNATTFRDTNFDPYRLRLFLDASVADGLEVYVQTVLSENNVGLRADGAYALWTPWRNRDLHLQAGNIPWPIGTWAPRKYSDKNPLIGEPLMYQHHTSLPWNMVPVDVDAQLALAGSAQTQIINNAAWVGMPVVDDRWWDSGVVAIGAIRPIEFAAGVTQGSPGWPEPGTEDTPGQSVLGRIGILPAPAVRLGVSGSYGPWIPRYFAYALPPDKKVTDYMEALGMADAELQVGRAELHGEAFLKTWETVNTGTLRVHGGYVESRFVLSALTWVGARAEMMRFSDLTPTIGEPRPWDDPLDRYEVGVGLRATREVRMKLTAQRDVHRRPGVPAEEFDAVSLAASIRF